MKQTILSKTATANQSELPVYKQVKIKRDSMASSGQDADSTHALGPNKAYEAFYPKLQYSNQVFTPFSMRASVTGSGGGAGGIFTQGLQSTTIDRHSYGSKEPPNMASLTQAQQQMDTLKSGGQAMSSYSGSNTQSKGLLHKQSLRLISANPSQRPSTSGPPSGNQIMRISSNMTFGDFKQGSKIIHSQSGTSSARQFQQVHRRLKSGCPQTSEAKEALQDSLRQQASQFQTHQLKPANSDYGSQETLPKFKRDKSAERTSAERHRSSQERIDYIKQTTNLLNRRQQKSVRSPGRLYSINSEGQVIILQSRIAQNQDQNSPVSDHRSNRKSGGKLKGGGTFEQLSTDETEVRFKVQHIEQTIQERAFSRYKEMVQTGRAEEDLHKVAAKINDITYKYRVQNGGGLNQPSYAFRYPQDVRVNRVSGLDIVPLPSANDDKIDYKNFQRHISQPNPEKVRQDYPIVGSGTQRPQSKRQISILHDPQKMHNFMDPPNRYSSKPRTSFLSTLPSQQVSPKGDKEYEFIEKKEKSSKQRVQTAQSKEAMLLKKMEEAKKKYLKKDVSSENVSAAKEQEGLSDDNINPNKDVHQARLSMFTKKSQHIRQHALSVEEKLVIQKEVAYDDRFIRSTIQTNRLRILSSDKGGKVPIDMQKMGFDNSTQQEFDQQYFDPLRLKILVMPYSEANPVGKNADYFFIKGFKYSVTEDYAHAMAAYLKGLDIKSDHLLCRFNLGVILFKLGLYHEASQQYSILASQGYSDRTFVMYNKALSELQAAQFEKTLESSQKCIAIIIKKKKANQSKLQTASNQDQQQQEKGRVSSNITEGQVFPDKFYRTEHQSVLSDNEIEMLADMHVVQGLANLRLLHLKRAGRCFDEAKAFKVPRKSEMMILIQKCVYKMVHERIMEDFRRRAKTQQLLSGNQGDIENLDRSKARGKNATTLSRNQRAQSVAKIYLTDLENPIFGKVKTKDGINIVDESVYQIDPKKVVPKKKMHRQMSARLPNTHLILDVMLEDGFQLGKESLFPKALPTTKPLASKPVQPTPDTFGGPSSMKTTPAATLQLKQTPPTVPLPPIENLEELSFPQLMDIAKTFIGARSDPKICYQYIDDEKTIRLDKILGLPNTFETKKAALTEKERTEKSRRDGIEFFMMQNMIKNVVKSSSKEEEDNAFPADLYPVKDRLTSGIPNQKVSDQEAFKDFMLQIKKFNQKLDLSLKYFLNDQGGAQNGKGQSGQSTQKKLDSEIEQGIKVIRDMIAAQKNKQPEIILPRLKVDELTQLEEEMAKPNKLDRNIETLEGMLLKLRSFKSLNPQLRKLVLLRSSFRKVSKNEVLYTQGEEGQCYYYMLRGSVTMLSRREDCGYFELFLKSYYDGECFGEQPQLFAKQQDNLVASDEQLHKLSLRDSTCIVNEESLILEVSNSVKHEFYRNDSSNEYERCIHWLKKNPIFKHTEGFYLLQMIFNIEKRSYILGEPLVKSGEVPDGMFIVTSGQCKAVMDGIGVNKVGSGEYSRFQQKPKNFACGNAPEKLLALTQKHIEPKTTETSPQGKEAIKTQIHQNLDSGAMKKFNPDISGLNYLKGDEKRTFPSTRLYIDDENKHIPNHIAFQNTIVYSQLVPGDSFGSRTLLPDDEIMKRMKPDELDLAKAQQSTLSTDAHGKSKSVTQNFGQSHSNQPVFAPNQASTTYLFRQAVQNLKTSALSIIADSDQVEVLILRWNILTFMPENEKDKIYTDIVNFNKAGKYGGADPDKPSSITEVMKIKNSTKKWEGYRVKLVDGIRKSQYMDRHKGVYKR